MKTEIQLFCKEYPQSLEPLGKALDSAINNIFEKWEGTSLSNPLAVLTDVHRPEQQARPRCEDRERHGREHGQGAAKGVHRFAPWIASASSRSASGT